MNSINDCTSEYPNVEKVPLEICQECKLRKLPESSDRRCACGNERLRKMGYDI